MEIHINRLTENLSYERTFLQIAMQERMITSKEYYKFKEALIAIEVYHDKVKAVKGEVFDI